MVKKYAINRIEVYHDAQRPSLTDISVQLSGRESLPRIKTLGSAVDKKADDYGVRLHAHSAPKLLTANKFIQPCDAPCP